MHKYAWLMPSGKNFFIWIISVVMLIGLFVFNWKPETILLSYFFETIIIGFIHIFKLWATYKYSTVADTPSGKHETKYAFYIPFFIFHFYFFIFVQSVFIFTFFSFYIPGIKDTFNVLDNYRFLLKQPEMLLAFTSLALVNISMSLQNFFFPKKFRTKKVKKLFMQPYLRIFIQQFVTLVTGFCILFINAPIFLALLIILTRLVVDLALQESAVNDEFRKNFVKVISQVKSEKDFGDAEKELDAFLDE